MRQNTDLSKSRRLFEIQSPEGRNAVEKIHMFYKIFSHDLSDLLAMKWEFIMGPINKINIEKGG